jgi:hypothetical protein
MISLLEATNRVCALHEVLPGDVPLHERISVIPLRESPTGFIDPLSGKDLKDTFDLSDPTTKPNLRMMAELRREKGGAVGVWLSPGRENKILVATYVSDCPILYDLTDQTFPPAEFAAFMTCLAPYYREGYYFLTEAPWEVLEAVIPAPLAWEAIRTDRARVEFERKVQKAREQGESRATYQTRYGVDINTACPAGGGESVARKLVSPDGKVKTFVENCGVCRGRIRDWMAPGDPCPHCGKVYQGVC